MKLRLPHFFCLCLLADGLAFNGCTPAPNNSQEGKEPYYLTGRRLIQQRDWDGAERAFFKSLESNPVVVPSNRAPVGSLCDSASFLLCPVFSRISEKKKTVG